MIKLIALDMDGTLLNSKKELPSDFFPFVLSHPDMKVSIASGRQYYALEKQFSEIKDHLLFIAENGTMVVNDGKVIYENVMNQDDVLFCMEKIGSIKDATLILCGKESAYMECSEEEELKEATKYYARLSQVDSLTEIAKTKEIIKIAIYFRHFSAEKHYPELVDLKPNLKTVLSGLSWIDISNADADKGFALKHVMEMYHIEKDEAMAFGDYLNDIEMLKAVHYSYAMKNAHPTIKDLCNYETDSNDEDGVMKVLRKL